MAKFFIPFLTPISTSSLVIKDSFSFVQELLNGDINSDSVVMDSFDVTSLFTKIPVGETIEIISNQIFANHVVFEGLDRSQFIKLLSLAVRNSHFTFKNRTYQQLMAWLWVVLLALSLLISSCPSMKKRGFTTVLLSSQLSFSPISTLR